MDRSTHMDGFFSPKNRVAKYKIFLGSSPQHVLLLPVLYVGEGQLPRLKLPESGSAIQVCLGRHGIPFDAMFGPPRQRCLAEVCCGL